MPDLKIDLDEQISQLRSRWDELKELWKDPPGPTADDKTDQTSRIEFWMDRINEKKLSLARIEVDKKAAQVTVRGLTPEEKQRAEDAMANLSLVIKKEQVFNNIVATITTILSSADTVIHAAHRA
jgi:hypothetical protein